MVALVEESEGGVVHVILVDLVTRAIICEREAKRTRWCSPLGDGALVWSDAEVGFRVVSTRGKPPEAEVILASPEPTCLGVWCRSPGNYSVAGGASDGTIRVWHLDLRGPPWSERKILEAKVHDGPVTSVTFTNDSCLASGSADRAIVLTRFAENAPLTGHIERRLHLTVRCRGMKIAGMKSTSEQELLAKLIAESQ